MEETNELLGIEYDLSLQPKLWRSQNILFSIGRKLRGEMKARAEKGDQNARKWLELMQRIEDRMQMRPS